MVPDTNRRALLSGAAMVAASLAGCGGDGGGGGSRPDDYVPETSTDSPGPDEGSGAYGLFLVNTTEAEKEVRVRVVLPWDDETLFERRLTVGSRTTREWNHVIDVDEEVAVIADLGAAIDGQLTDRGKERRLNDHLWLTPGSETAPAVENVQIRIGPDDDGSHVRVGTIDEFQDPR